MSTEAGEVAESKELHLLTIDDGRVKSCAKKVYNLKSQSPGNVSPRTSLKKKVLSYFPVSL